KTARPDGGVHRGRGPGPAPGEGIFGRRRELPGENLREENRGGRDRAFALRGRPARAWCPGERLEATRQARASPCVRGVRLCSRVHNINRR
ncbi:unnamed protein product, partial [Amoebophrya sp. A120]